MQGLGSALVAPQILSLIQTTVPEHRRARVLGRYGATMAMAPLAGPLFSGILLHLNPFGLGWRVALALPVPVGAAALALFRVLPRPSRPAGASRGDPAGAVLSLAGLVLLVLPLTLGQDAGWPVWTWLSLAAAVVVLAAFAAVGDRRGAGVQRRDPVVHLLLSLQLQGVLHRSPLQTALTVAPYAVGALLGSGVAEAAARRYGAGALAAASGGLAAVSLLVVPAMAAPAPLLWAVLGAGGFAFGLFTRRASPWC